MNRSLTPWEVTFVLILLLATICTSTSRGQASHEGFEIKVAAIHAEDSRVRIEIHVTNNGDSRFFYLPPDSPHNRGAWTLNFVDAHGALVKVQKQETDSPGKVDWAPLNPGSTTKEFINLTDGTWAPLAGGLADGTIRNFFVEYNMSVEKPTGRFNWSYELWAGRLKSEMAELPLQLRAVFRDVRLGQ